MHVCKPLNQLVALVEKHKKLFQMARAAKSKRKNKNKKKSVSTSSYIIYAVNKRVFYGFAIILH